VRGSGSGRRQCSASLLTAAAQAEHCTHQPPPIAAAGRSDQTAAHTQAQPPAHPPNPAGPRGPNRWSRAREREGREEPADAVGSPLTTGSRLSFCPNATSRALHCSSLSPPLVCSYLSLGLRAASWVCLSLLPTKRPHQIPYPIHLLPPHKNISPPSAVAAAASPPFRLPSPPFPLPPSRVSPAAAAARSEADAARSHGAAAAAPGTVQLRYARPFHGQIRSASAGSWVSLSLPLIVSGWAPRALVLMGSCVLAGDPLYPELWRACAGPLVTVPRPGDLVFYFPQGHIEQVLAAASTPFSARAGAGLLCSGR